MSFEDLAERLSHHESASQKRFETLHHAINEMKGNNMSETPSVRNVFEPVINPGGMGGYGGVGGFGGFGGDGGLLALALLGGGGFGGRRDHGGRDRDDCASTDQLQTATGSITDVIQNTAIQGTLAGISAAIPLAEAQVQLSVAGAVGEIRSHIGQVENTLVQGQTSINKNVSDAIAASLASQNNLNVNILTQGSATRDSVNAMGVANLTATSNSTKEILAAINAQNMADLQRQLTEANIARAEDRADSRARGTEVNVTQTVTQNQIQLQAQTQAQRQEQAIIQLAECVRNLAGDVQAVRQTQSQVVFGNNIGSGQAANATNNSVR